MNETKEGGIASFFDLGGKISLITGAGRGIGRAVALTLARAGSDVALVARSEDELQSAAREIQLLGRRAMVFPADLTQIQQISSLVDDIARAAGGIDILVNNAGINIPQDSVDVTEEAWDAVMNINLKGAFFMAQAVGKVMIAQARGGTDHQHDVSNRLGGACQAGGLLRQQSGTEPGHQGLGHGVGRPRDSRQCRGTDVY